MAGITLTVALICAILIFCLKPAKGLILYIALIAWFPFYMYVQLGTINFTACRIVILAIYINIFFFTDLSKKFKFIALDKAVIVYFIAQVIAGLVTTPMAQLLENRAGATFDMLLPYFAVRMIITDKQKYVALLRSLLFITAPLGLLGVYQAVTGFNIFSIVPGNTFGQNIKFRSGFYRANLSFSVSIMFGLYFAMLAPTCIGLWKTLVRERGLITPLVICMFLGLMSSLSSGPWLAMIVSVAFLIAYRYRAYWKSAVILLVICCATVEVISNRHFWETIDRFTLSSKTAWYRSRLIEVGLFEGGMNNHWIAGYGLKDPGWSLRIDHRDHTDMVNHYLLILSRFGLIGFIPFCIMLRLALRSLVRSFRTAMSESDRWLIWSLSATLVGLLVAIFSVSMFGPPRTVFYLLLGFCPLMEHIVNNTNAQYQANELENTYDLTGQNDLALR